MKTIAWTRLMFFIGSSILLLAQMYLFTVEILSFLVIAPALFSLLQYFVQISFFLGFLLLSISYFRLYNSNPLLLQPDRYNPAILKKLVIVSSTLSLLLFILLLIPPTSALSESIRTLFSELVIVLWIAYYILILLWLIYQWLLFNKKRAFQFKNFFHDYIFLSHIILTIILSALWFCEGLLLAFQVDLFSIQMFNLCYILVLLIFSIHQSLFFFKATRFSYVIIG
ncbi:MAG: hypothetical protein ACTSW1_00875 [Candidatus Hodarchaeales archaeon]